jgi:hypothetical protein
VVVTQDGARGVRAGAKEPSLGELVATATRDMSLLVRQEISLAKAELRQQAMSAGLGMGFLVVAGGLAFFALLAVTIGIGELLTWAGLERFWAYFVTAGFYLVVAAMLGMFAVTRFKKLGPPARTVQTVKDDVAWIKHPTIAPERPVRAH